MCSYINTPEQTFKLAEDYFPFNSSIAYYILRLSLNGGKIRIQDNFWDTGVVFFHVDIVTYLPFACFAMQFHQFDTNNKLCSLPTHI